MREECAGEETSRGDMQKETNERRASMAGGDPFWLPGEAVQGPQLQEALN